MSREWSCEAVFGVGGCLSSVLDDYEVRPSQQCMAQTILDCFTEGEVALLEAGTGMGKTLAYLYPAVQKALVQKRTVISTHTINLQQQLLQKDIPLLLTTLGAEVRVVLVKGMHNYVCMRRLCDALAEGPRLEDATLGELELLKDWASNSDDGTRSDLSCSVSSLVWEQSCVEAQSCTHKACPHHERCAFLRDRSECLDAQIWVVNHHLLLADLQLKEQIGAEGGILPSFDYLVIDEAHHFEEVATESLARRVSRRALMRLYGQLFKEQRGRPFVGKLSQLQLKVAPLLQEGAPGVEALASLLEVTLPSELRRLMALTHEAFELVTLLSDKGTNVRVRPQQLKSTCWEEQIAPSLKGLVAGLRGFVQTLDALRERISSSCEELLRERTRPLRKDIQSIGGRLEAAADTLEHFMDCSIEEDEVRWLECQGPGALQLEMVSASLNVARLLSEKLYSGLESVVFVSATLTTSGQFSYVRDRLGLTEEYLAGRPLREAVFDSPFSYETQVLFVAPTDLPPPTHPRFEEACVECIWEMIDASRGNAFILFTSYQMLHHCSERLEERCRIASYAVLRQGDRDRLSLLEAFKEAEGSVLFGTDSFWEGVDVVGEALRCVILVKLPFKVPTEPLVEARLEKLAAAGHNPFMGYSVPSAIVKFKQGFGRLVRNKNDRGCVACLDSRLVQKPYGRLFLQSLPPCRQLIATRETVVTEMQQFFRGLECSGIEPLTSTMPLLRSTN